MTLAERVATERGEIVGQTVGVSISFVDRCTEQTHIKVRHAASFDISPTFNHKLTHRFSITQYMTEGILLREMLADPLLQQYSVIMIDEAHERNIFTDVVMGLLKKIIRKRPALKLIITSATIDAEFFQRFYNVSQTGAGSSSSSGVSSKKPTDSACILSVEGRRHPVTIHHLQAPCADYVKETVNTIMKIHRGDRPGDILAFVTGQEEVADVVSLLREHIDAAAAAAGGKEDLLVLPMYGTLTNADQLRVFFAAPKGVRKAIVATNIAETSVTIPDIVYVVDCGFVKTKWFDADSRTDSLIVVPISRAAAEQRAGRAGRCRSGKVYRLYTETEHAALLAQSAPEMRRADLCSTVLYLKALGIENILRFDFPAPPPAKHLLATLETLFALGAIARNGDLTRPLGYFLAELPVTPMMGKMLYDSIEMGCSAEILSIIAMLQVQSVFSRPTTGQGQLQARVKKRAFEVAEGDLVALLNVYTGFVRAGRTKEWCGRNYCIYRNLKRAYELREQLQRLVRAQIGMPIVSCAGDVRVLQRCIASGFFANAAYMHPSGVYRTCRGNRELHVHPLSGLYTLRPPQFVVFCELLNTTKVFMKDLTVIEGEWLLELAPHYYERSGVRMEDR